MMSSLVSSVHAQSPPDESLFVRASVDNQRPYLGQQIVYIYRIYQGAGLPPLAGQIRYEPPAFAGFWNSQSSEQDEYTETIDSREYRVVELRTMLFPSVVGTIAIEPGSLTVPTASSVAPNVIESAPVAVDVRPLPPGAPEGFTGAVGRFGISAEVDATTGEVNEPLQLTVRVSGEGNIEALPDPVWPTFVGWRVIESPEDAATQTVDARVTGSRTYEIVMVPDRAGELTIPEIGYAHFDPDLGQYVHAATAPTIVSITDADGLPSVAPLPVASSEAEGDGLEMRPIKAVPSSLRLSGRELTDRAAYWAGWGVPLLVLVAALVWRRRQVALEAGLAVSRRQNALRDAQTALLRAVASGDDPRVASAEAVLSFLSARLETPVGGLTQEALLRRLREAGVPPDLEHRLEDTLAARRGGRVLPIGGFRRRKPGPCRPRRAAVDRTRGGHGRMTRLWRLFIGPLAAFGALVAIVGVVFAQAPPPLELMDEGNRRYERGEFAEAAQVYEALIDQGFRDTAVYYNLGNTYLESGDLGRAVLSYLRAEELSPRDPDILVNLELVRKQDRGPN